MCSRMKDSVSDLGLSRLHDCNIELESVFSFCLYVKYFKCFDKTVARVGLCSISDSSLSSFLHRVTLIVSHDSPMTVCVLDSWS
jgi:hypothetical protein